MSIFTDINYPYFKSGQVLKNTDLNHMVEYLDEQNRLTRVLVVGSGIFSGLEVDITHDDSENAPIFINISQGFGVSSDGYIIQLRDSDASKILQYGYYKRLDISANNFRCQPTNDTDDVQPSWITFELLQDKGEQNGENAIKPLIQLAEDELVDEGPYCLVLWVSHEEKDRPYCIDVCDDNGADLEFTIKPLLVKSEDLQSIINQSQQEELVNNFNPPSIHIPPFGSMENEVAIPGGEGMAKINVVNPALVENYEEYRRNYIEIISKVIDENAGLITAFNWAYDHMGVLGLAGSENPFTQLSSNLMQLLEQYSNPVVEPGTTPQNIEIQYLYLYLHDLKEAYEEFVHTVCGVKTSLLPDICKHVRHIGLAGIYINKSEYPFLTESSECRNSYQPSLFNGVSSSLISKVELLFQRLKKLTTINGHGKTRILELPVNLEKYHYIRVVPGRERQKLLSKHSIPYYYNKQVESSWSAGDGLNCLDDKVTGYRFLDDKHVFPDDNPLIQQDDEFGFYRIEGHVGKNTTEAYEMLKTWKDQFNLPFDIKVVYLDILEFGHEEYGSIEMKMLEEKYSEIRETFLDFIKRIGRQAPPEIILPYNLESFECNPLRQWYGYDYYQTGNEAECYINAFLVLRITYDIEQKSLRNLFRFSEFAQSHSGMQHLGGVHKGGTFVLVNMTVIDPEIEAFLKGRRQLKKLSSFNTSVTINSSEINRYIEENSSHVVVGDFALPYLCCGGDTLVEPLIIMIPDKFCSDDTNKYEIFTYPRGGVVKGSLQNQANNRADLPPYISFDGTTQMYYFHPNQVLQEGDEEVNLDLIYKMSSLSDKKNVTVYQKPNEIEVGWTRTAVFDENRKLVGQKVILTVLSEDNVNYYWMIDGVRVEDNNSAPLERTFYYRNKTQFALSLVLVNGICETKQDFQFNLCELIKDVSMDFESVPQFSEDPEEDESVAIVVSHPGGSFRMKDSDGKYFDPDIEVILMVDDNGNQIIQYRLINSAKNPLPAGRYFISYTMPVCGLETDPHDFFVQSEAVIVLKRYAFCSNDTQRYPIYVYPTDAEIIIDSENGLIKEGAQYFFEPSAITEFADNKASVTLSAIVGGATQATQVLTIFKVPNEIIRKSFEPVYNQNEYCQLLYYRFVFIAGEGIADRYEWQVNDQTYEVTNENREVEIKIQMSPGSTVVKLLTETSITPDDPSKIGNQSLVCRHEINYDVDNLCPDRDKVQLNISFDPDRPQVFQIAANPSGGTFYIMDEKNENILVANPPISILSEEPCGEISDFQLNTSELKLPPGQYVLRYVFTECEIFASAIFEVQRQIEGSGETETPTDTIPATDISEEPGTTTSIESAKLSQIMNARAKKRDLLIDELQIDSSLARTKSFGLAKMFTLFAGDVGELNKRFTQSSDLLINSIKRSSGDRKGQYEVLLEVVTHAYLDKLLISNPEKLGEETEEVLKELSEKLKQVKFKKNRLVKNWQGENLKDVLKTPTVDEVKKMLK